MRRLRPSAVLSAHNSRAIAATSSPMASAGAPRTAECAPGRPQRRLDLRAVRRHHLRPDITPTHPTENALRTTAARVGASGLGTSRPAPAGCRLRPGIMCSSSSRQVRLTLPWLSAHPWCRESETPAIAGETWTGCRGRAKVSNEVSNYCGANRQPRLDDPGSFGAPGILIDDHLVCFTRKRSLFQGDHETVAI